MRYVDGRWGRTWFYGKDEYVGRSLFFYGEYNPDETEMILSLASGLCLDIGANFGCMGQALECSGFNVVSFEPQPDVYSVLVKNVRGACYNLGLSDVPASLTMPKILTGSRANYGGQSIGTRSELGTIPVSVVTLDSFNFTDVGFMKIDVEGFEERVLRGAVDTIARCRPIMYIEDDRTDRSASLRDFITSLGYSIEEHKPTLYREKNFFDHKRNVWDRNYASHNIICRPIC
jgi:FkbM family methyltransferase